MTIFKREDFFNDHGDIVYENAGDFEDKTLFCGSPTQPSGGIYAPKYVGFNTKYGFSYPVSLDRDWIDIWNHKDYHFVNKGDKLEPKIMHNPSTNAPPYFFYNYRTGEFFLDPDKYVKENYETESRD